MVKLSRFGNLTVAFAVGAVALLVPICASILLTWNESLASERLGQLGDAGEILRRSDELAHQIEAAARLLAQDGVPPCSPRELDVMRQIELGSNYVQAAGRISGNTILCTSLATGQPIFLGNPDVVSEHGLREWLSVRLSGAQWHPLSIVASQNVALIIDPSLLVDVPLQSRDSEFALFVPSSPHHTTIAAHGTDFNPRWFDPIPRGTQRTFLDGAYIVSVVRSQSYDLAVAVATPQRYLYGRIVHFALIFTPIGLACGIGLAWAVLAIARVRSSFQSRVRSGARHGEFFVEYQPIVDLHSRRWTGAEALVRWKSEGAVIRPDHFIPLAEDLGVITLVTEQVISQVAADFPSLLELDPHFTVAINLSAADLSFSRTVSLLENLLRSAGAPPSALEVEATERAWLQAPETGETIDLIRGLGCRVAIDDFGTGYSSLACLQSLRVDTLKIDKAFVETIDTDGATSEVILHIIAMAHSLRLGMIAEGVETEPQAAFLRQRGVHHAQGWLFARPMSAAELRAALELQRRQRVTANA